MGYFFFTNTCKQTDSQVKKKKVLLSIAGFQKIKCKKTHRNKIPVHYKSITRARSKHQQKSSFSDYDFTCSDCGLIFWDKQISSVV